MIFKLKNLFILFLLFAFANVYAEEQIHLLCVSFAESRSIYQQQISTLDSIIAHTESPCIILSQPVSQSWNNPDVPHFSLFNPILFSIFYENTTHGFEVSTDTLQNQTDKSITGQGESLLYPPVIISNFTCDSSYISYLDHYIMTYSDSVKIGFLGIASPDLPHLVENIPPTSAMRFDIFGCAKEMSTLFLKQNVSAIIALNYLGDFLDRELLWKVPEISFIIDTFEDKKANHIITDSVLHLSLTSKSIIDVQLSISDGNLREINTKVY